MLYPTVSRLDVPYFEHDNPSSGHINPLLNDKYQLTMAYSYWRSNRHNEIAVFDLFFRKNPFKGEFTIFAGLTECIRYLQDFAFTKGHVDYIRRVLSGVHEDFLKYLKEMNMNDVVVYAQKEGSVVFPRVPLLRIEGPLAKIQLLETTFLNIINFSSLVCTNAARMRARAGENKIMVEFGLRRAQGPNGAMTASRYTYMGGFDGTSNLLAGYHFDIQVFGTHAHSYVQSFSSLDQVSESTLKHAETGEEFNFVDLVAEARKELGFMHTNDGELAAFISYAMCYPKGFLALVDTYDTLQSGVPNFLVVATALHKLGYDAIGIRLDSGDLSFLSKTARTMFLEIGEKAGLKFEKFNITASNDINESTIISLNEQGHSIDTFGIGTHLVTCQAQPALGCVFKLVQIGETPRIKLSQDIGKVTIPGKKSGYRLFGANGMPLLDVMLLDSEDVPKEKVRILCRHPFEEGKRAIVIPSKVESLHQCVWKGGKAVLPEENIHVLRQRVKDQIASLRRDHVRSLNPTPYKIAVSKSLYNFIHDLWMSEAPIAEIE